MSLTVSDLEGQTAYYWKVTASDGADTVESEVREFTTR
jgi:hypothetical protein